MPSARSVLQGLIALDKIEIFGQLTASSTNEAAGGGGPVTTVNGKGGGPGGGGPQLSYNASGGGSYCGIGGKGNAVDGIAGAGGPAYGNAPLVPLLGGSAGGGESMLAGGGAGGGALQLVAGGSITVGVTGIVDAEGGGANTNGGGGGSGRILIDTRAGSAVITGTISPAATTLNRHGVRFMLVGLSAAVLQCANTATRDIDIWFEDVSDVRIGRPALRDDLAATTIVDRVPRELGREPIA